MATLKEFEDALREAGNTEALEILERLKARDRANRSIRPARRLTGQRMTSELAAEIVRLHRATDMTQQEIAFQLGVNQGRVNEVLKRGKWLDGDPAAPEAVARDKAVERAKRGEGFEPSSRRKAKPQPDVAAQQDQQPDSQPHAPAAPPAPVAAKPAFELAAPELREPAEAETPKAEPPKAEPVKAEAKQPDAEKTPARKKPARKQAEPKAEPAEEPAQLLFKL